MSLRFFFTLTLLLSASLHAEVKIDFTEDTLTDAETNNSYCGSVQVSAMCRAMAWPPRTTEGVTLVGSLAIVVVDEKPPEGHSYNALLSSVLNARKFEIFGALLLSEPGMIQAIATAPFADVMVVFRNSQRQNVAALKAPRAVVAGQALLNETWKAAMKDKVAWEPPADFTPFYSFETF